VADANQGTETALEKAPEKTGRSLGPVLFFIVLAIFGGWWWSAQRKGAENRASSAVKSTLHLETFVVNLADREGRSYLRLGVDLGLNHELKHGEDPPVAHVRDTILTILATAKADDLLSAEGKAALKTELLQGLKERVPELGVEEVYFTELLIQR
jgi:flagellar basal body-associated protein FliL